MEPSQPEICNSQHRRSIGFLEPENVFRLDVTMSSKFFLPWYYFEFRVLGNQGASPWLEIDCRFEVMD